MDSSLGLRFWDNVALVRPSGGGQQLWEMRLLATRRHGPFLQLLTQVFSNDKIL